jgi:HSP20 family protein
MAPKHEPETQSGQRALTAPRSQWSLMDLHSEVDRLFDDFARGFGWPSMGRSFFEDRPFRRLESAMTTPSMRVNVAETDSAYEIEAELPGLDQKDIELKVSDGVMTLSGERKAEQEEKKKDYHLMERSYGSFRRSFALPDNVVEDKIDAKFANGVLMVTLPKREPGATKPGERKIDIKAG